MLTKNQYLESWAGLMRRLSIQLESLWKFSLLNSRVLLIPSFETIKQCVVLIAQQIRSMGGGGIRFFVLLQCTIEQS